MGNPWCPFFLPAAGLCRACASHVKASFPAVYTCHSSRSRFLSDGVLKIKHVWSKRFCVSFCKKNHARMKFIPERTLPMLVINNLSDFFLLEAKKHPCLPMSPKHQNFPQFQKQSPTFAYRWTAQACIYLWLLSGTLYYVFSDAGVEASLPRCCCYPFKMNFVSLSSGEVLC